MRRYVSLAPSCTETLFALGCGDEVVGVTTWCDFPAEAQGKPKVGGFVGLDARAILDLKPDLVFASSTALGDQAKVLAQVREAGVEVHAGYPRDVAGVLESFLAYGVLTGRHKEAAQLIDTTRLALESIVDGVPAQAPRPRVYYEEWGPQPLMTVSDGLWIHDMLGLAGGDNVFAGAGAEEPVVTPQEVVAKDPEVIVAGWCGALGKKPAIAELLARPGWRGTSAGRSGRVHVVDDTYFTRPGPRLPEGLAQLAALLHPTKA